jgi:Tfp pilus assembly protein PilP
MIKGWDTMSYDWHNKLIKSIKSLSYSGLIDALAQSQSQSKSHGSKNFSYSMYQYQNKQFIPYDTLNLCIESLLNQSVEKFDLRFIDALMYHGIKNKQSLDSSEINVYEKTIRCSDHYIDMNPGKVKQVHDNILRLFETFVDHELESSGEAMIHALKTKNKDWIQIVFNNLDCRDLDILLDLIISQEIGMIQTLIDFYAQNNVPMTDPKILNCAMETRNINIVQMIIDLCEPNVNSSTMTYAIKTKNHQIIHLVLDCMIKNESLNHIIYADLLSVVFICDEKIIKVLIAKGLGPMLARSITIYTLFDRKSHHSLIHSIWDSIKKYDPKDENHILELLMCIGAKIKPIPRDLLDGSLEWLERKAIDCHGLQNKLYDPEDRSSQSQSIRELRKSLIKTMDNLMAWPCTKDQRIREIDDSLNHWIPVPCIDLIYGYQIDSLVKYIDWSKD